MTRLAVNKRISIFLKSLFQSFPPLKRHNERGASEVSTCSSARMRSTWKMTAPTVPPWGESPALSCHPRAGARPRATPFSLLHGGNSDATFRRKRPFRVFPDVVDRRSPTRISPARSIRVTARVRWVTAASSVRESTPDPRHEPRPLISPARHPR